MLLYVRWIQCYSDVVNFNRKLNRALIPEVGPFQSITKVQKILKVCFFFFFLSLLNSMNLPWCEWIDLHKYAGATFVTQEAALLKVIMKYCACWDLSDLNDWKGRVPMISNMPDMLYMTAYGLTSNMCTGPSSLHHYRCEMAAVWFGHQNYLVRFK